MRIIGGEPLPNGTKVSFCLSDVVTGTGMIRGIHTMPQPVLGYGYIVEWDFLSCAPYAYPCISVFDSGITVME
jgi:hypothetical protein